MWQKKDSHLTFLVMKHDAVYADPVGGAGLQLQRDMLYIRFKPVFCCRAVVRHFDDSHHVGGGPEVLRCNIFNKTELANGKTKLRLYFEDWIPGSSILLISILSSVP